MYLSMYSDSIRTRIDFMIGHTFVSFITQGS